ncbi:ribonuclease H-like domain-containing protein [Tanacetum coccineum]|uniref:Ribonuclease H-like domain-containing protein n=1 Tax=Tanacetum coccineum TaxID=301880 RepID=A0ABQ5DB58_9ASTR
MHAPCEPHLATLKRIIRYVRALLIMVFNYMFLLPLNSLHTPMLIRQVAQSPEDPLLEVEYRGAANVVAEIVWIRNLLLELHAPLHTPTLVYCANVSAVYLSTNSVQHQRIKHI